MSAGPAFQPTRFAGAMDHKTSYSFVLLAAIAGLSGFAMAAETGGAASPASDSVVPRAKTKRAHVNVPPKLTTEMKNGTLVFAVGVRVPAQSYNDNDF